MALSGTLQDMAIVDLIQHPHSSRRTGEMIIVGGESEARLYYKHGALVHAEMGEQEGLDVVVEIVDWNEGEFEFRRGIETKRRSFEWDLHRTLMQALKIRDERKLEEQRLAAEREEQERLLRKYGATASDEMDPVLFKTLADFMDGSTFALHSCIVAPSGQTRAEASSRGQPPGKLDELKETLLGLYKNYPRPGLARVFLEDAKGTVVFNQLTDKSILMVVAREGAPLGAVTMGVNKIVASLEKPGG